MTKEERKEYRRAYYEAHKEEQIARQKAYNKAHKEEQKNYQKIWHRDYYKGDVNSSGKSKGIIRQQSRRYLSQHGTKKPGYEIHHCFTYDEPYKFIYCPKETHLLIHAYLREHNIDADSEHYEQIKHLLDKTVVLYNIN